MTEFPQQSAVCGQQEAPVEINEPSSAETVLAGEESCSSLLSSSQQFSDQGDELKPENPQKCTLCNCGERSLLGQGDLTRYDPSFGFNVLKRAQSRSRRGSSESEKDIINERGPKHLTWRRQRGPIKPGRDKMKSPRRPNPHSMQDDKGQPIAIVDELSNIGFPMDTDVEQLFETSGHNWAHHCCAAWSEGVCQNEDYTLVNVDKAVFNGMNQKCSYCQRYGATIFCRIPKCGKLYHYPCAASAGTFQDIKSMSLLCPDHLNQAEEIAGPESLCVVCDTAGEISEQLFCTSCGQHYHGNCLDPPVLVNSKVRAGWQCPDCKICQTCRQPGDDSKMLVCDKCDKGYHTFCLRPVMTTIPKNGWKCKNCRVCGDCGSRTPGSGPSSRWHLNYSVCDSCYQQRNKGLFCPLCGKAYRHFTQKAMVQCTLCKKHIHSECDPALDTWQQQKEGEMGGSVGVGGEKYICPVCKDRDPNEVFEVPELALSQGSSELFLGGEAKQQSIDDFSFFKMDTKQERPESVDSKMELGDEALTSSQEESCMSLGDNSVSSMDIDLNVFEKEAQELAKQAAVAEAPSGESKGKPMHGMGKPQIIARKKQGVGRPPKGSSKLVKRHRKAMPGERKRGPKPKFKTGHIIATNTQFASQIGATPGEKVNLKSLNRQQQDDDDDNPHSTPVLCAANDLFVLSQDMCYSCGSLGRGEEGRLVSCSQCGQCYHPYCAGIKITKVILNKGWRCLDCTVCEGCGQPHDEGRLLLCDDCDVSYHTYCLDPPLDNVPAGTWKCKWCVDVSAVWSDRVPGRLESAWQENYTRCAPCSSLASCWVCEENYIENDLVIQCTNCDRWLHTSCDGMHNEDDVERAADWGYHCLVCRQSTHRSKYPPPPPKPPKPPKEPMLPEKEPADNAEAASVTMPMVPLFSDI
ncbi:PREDICTED: histone-lysine N-methyltransferase 2C-like, partial [Priapulus caudatus]|uniref:Histone-lysine N-methyltransferase 2C-like n=1 Tax=Priapulus caudatus TaxID=37621 RepID=A0ABM1F0G0_PRICU